MGRYELTDDVREAFPDEREALRGLAHAVHTLIGNLRMGDEPIVQSSDGSPSVPLPLWVGFGLRKAECGECGLRFGGKEPEALYRLHWVASHAPDTLGWKNELSVSSLLDIEGKWLPLARERLGLEVPS